MARRKNTDEIAPDTQVEMSAEETKEAVTAANDAVKAEELASSPATKPVKPPCVCASCKAQEAVLLNRRIM